MKLEQRIKDKLEEPTKSVDIFEARNRIHFINQNVMSVVRFYSGPIKFTLGWLDIIDMMIRQHLAQQGMRMKRGMATSSLYMKPGRHGMGLEEFCCRLPAGIGQTPPPVQVGAHLQERVVLEDG